MKKTRGNYKVKESSKIKLMSYYKKLNNGKLDKLGKMIEDGK